MTDQDVRDLLERIAGEEPLPFFDAEPLTRRARRRAKRTIVVGAVGVAAALALVFGAASQLLDGSPNPFVTDLTPTPPSVDGGPSPTRSTATSTSPSRTG